MNVTETNAASSAEGLAVHRHLPVVVPIRSLGENHRGRIADHLKHLDPDARYFRFGFAASDAQIDRYVDGLDFERDEIFGIYNRHLKLVAMAHLAFSVDMRLHACSEFGVSVLAQSRGRGFGSRLFDRAVIHARNEGVQMMFIHMLNQNAGMLKIARNGGAEVVREGDESEGYLKLPPATVNTQLAELMQEHIALSNYQFKRHTMQFRDTLDRFVGLWGSAASTKAGT